MKKQLFFLSALLLCPVAQAQKPQLDWGVALDYIFDNAEYDRSDNTFESAGTLHAVRVTPSIGLKIDQGADITHRVRMGVDLMKNTGENLPAGSAFKELTFWYDLRSRLSNGACFEALAGCFPRSSYEGRYRGPLFDTRALYCDNNVEGMLFKYRNSDIYAELGLDWMGMLGDVQYPERRERFQVLSYGDWRFAGPFHFTWTGSFYHFACSKVALGVVDNHTLIPMLEWRPRTALEKLSVSAGAILTYQRDRELSKHVQTPSGFYSRQEVENWHVCIHNQVFAGDNLQQYQSTYGRDLYPGQDMFRTISESAAWADELYIFYNPQVSELLQIYVGAAFNFGTPGPDFGVYRGCRQTVSLRFNLEKFTAVKKKSRTGLDILRDIFL